MSTTTKQVSAVTNAVLAKVEDFAVRMQSLMPSMIVEAGHYKNPAYLLRAYVSMRPDNQGGELAMTVDVRGLTVADNSLSMSIHADLCQDDGTIVLTGPSAHVESSRPGFDEELSDWCDRFDDFLSQCEAVAPSVFPELQIRNTEDGPSF